MSDWGLFKEEYPEARRIRSTLEEFLGELSDELSPSTVEKLVFGTVRLCDLDSEFEYKPEEFTRKLLVDECLAAVGLEYRPQPKVHGSERDRWPDFEFSNTVISVVGEVKSLNDISSGEDQIKTYLSLDWSLQSTQRNTANAWGQIG